MIIDGRILAIERASIRLFASMLSSEPKAKKLTERQEAKITEAEGNIALISMHGFVFQHPNIWTMFGMGVSTSEVATQLVEAANDSSIKQIVLHMNSPGGTVYGVQELATLIRDVRAKKPVIAHVDSVAASAMYWLASQATEIVVAPGGDVGSIGVYMVHDDYSQAMEDAGIKETYIYAGKYKVEGNPSEPLSDESKDYYQQRVDKMYRAFVADVALGRGVDTKQVLSDFGQGRLIDADAAVKASMADRVAGFSATIRRFANVNTKLQTRRRMLADLAKGEAQ